MAQYYLQVDGTTGKKKRVPALYADTSATSSGQVDFSVSGLTASNLVDVWVNGLRQVEGGGEDYTRNVGANKITFNATVPANAVVKIRVWS